MKKSLVDEYRECVEICENIDYGNSLSVRANNRAVTKMYKMVRKAAKEGNKGLEPLFELLIEPAASEWLSFQLLEIAEALPHEIESRCLETIQHIASDNTRHATSFGARVWLERWEQNKSLKNSNVL